ncbi:transcriptional regulator Kaiso isoform X2 [Rhinatrema bivittatum]|uniref:transcriptional regulator Kaiso isoform X2 n=1 Tax=Rhinatrema bivittatum TaxID=194408 RepID=UPI00112C7667|nr:transcriptional regulator Kaiso isoform X2 [Rhinatrema bivittatum]XP_029463697.1 transcriptional regulator Kaiso isoform X2 [Rhinatrema bivittatum]
MLSQNTQREQPSFEVGMESKKLISATDTQYSGTLLKSLNEQRIHGLFCDVTIIVEDRKFRAHRNILSASSSYFYQLFSVAGQVVELSFVRAEIFAEILNYIYSSKIVRVRSDSLEELIKSGQLLGVKFIAELGVPLSQVKNISDGGKDGSPEESPSSSDQKDPEMQSSTNQSAKTGLNQEGEPSAMPVIAEAFSLSGDKFSTSKKAADSKEIDDDSDDDVIFCSELVPPKDRPSHAAETIQLHPSPNAPCTSDQKTNSNNSRSPAPTQFIPNATPLTVTSSQKLSASVNNLSSPNLLQSNVESLGSTQKLQAFNTIMLNPHHLNSSPSISSSYQKQPTINLLMPKQQLPNSVILPKSELSNDRSCSSSADAMMSSIVDQPATTVATVFEGSGFHKKQVASFTQQSSSKPGEFKLKVCDVAPGSTRESPAGMGSQHIMDGKKIITLDTASEIEGLSTGCKVYANIGEDTYDIVIPVKDDPEGESRLNSDFPHTSGEDSPNSKRMKLKHDDHYELIVDGKVYYICIVCKRSYVCLTSLRRHFNVHSWEKKYPCRYCDKVFPLAEYRTKHEIHHTGERRYQCLTCGKAFINYQVMASHIRSVHSQDPSGDSKLYRLHPCRSLQIRQYAYITDPSSSIPIINEDGIVYHVDNNKDTTTAEGTGPAPQTKPMTWDDIFIQQDSQTIFKPSVSEASSEFEFVIPESY